MEDLEGLLIEQEKNNKIYNRVTNQKQLKELVEHPEDNKILTATGNTDIWII